MKSIKSLLPAAALAAIIALPAQAQTSAQVQSLIVSGQETQALQELQGVLQTHPHSGLGWYLTAEAQDALGNEQAARDALAKADQYAPGLPFANAGDAASLRAHLSASSGGGLAGGGVAPAGHGGVSMPVLVIAGLVLLFLFLRIFRRRRTYPVYPGSPQQPYYGPGNMPYGPGPMGGGLGSSILGGLAAGAGFAAGERVIDSLMGGGQPRYPQDQFNNADPQIPDRDDGLQGNPGWDDGSNGGGLDDNNNSW